MRQTFYEFCMLHERTNLLKEWDKSRNFPLTPDTVSYGSNKKVWWQCSMGHVWKSVIYPRTGAQQCGCPVCAGKVSTTHARGVTPSSTKFAPLPSCDKTNSIKTIKAVGSDVLSAALLVPDLDALSALCLVLTRFLSRFRQKAAPLSIAARGSTICSMSQLVAAGKTNDCYMWTLAPGFSLCYNAVTLIG